jgi:CheY-like chemotaxis protein/anti-sigma regulatory factor (Ser/Thr protein kinase)
MNASYDPPAAAGADTLESLRRRCEAAEAQARSRADLLAHISHEIRTPMQGAGGYAQLLLGTEVQPEQRKYAEMILEQLAVATQILNEVLDLSKLESGMMQLESKPFQPTEEVLAAVEGLRGLATHKGLALEFIVSSTPPRVVGDPLRFRQVITNLVGNAVKFTQQGGVTVRLGSLAGGAGTARVLVAVTDTGPGIDAEAQKRVFDPFFQVPGAGVAQQGSGLGLAIVRMLCRQMGGQVLLESRAGVGSTFSIDLSLRIHSEAQAPAAASTRSEVSPAAAGAASQPPRKETVRTDLSLALVDDHPTGRSVGKAFIGRCGYESDVFDSGQALLDAIATGKRYDLVFMDIRMPEMDGFETTRRLFALFDQLGSARPVVIALSADAVREVRDRCAEMGMHSFLSKPTRLVDMQASIDEVRKIRSSVPA